MEINGNKMELATIISAPNSKRSLEVAPQGPASDPMIQVQRNAVKDLARRYRSVNSPALCFQSGEKSIFAITKEVGEEEMEATFTLHLVALSRYLNLKNGLTDEQIDFVVEKLLTEYKWLNMADFALVIDRIKSNYYGSFYENFSGQKFLEIMQQYDYERTCEIERIRDEENQAHRSRNPLEDKPIDEVTKLIEKWRVQSLEAQEENTRKREAEARNREEIKDTMERISREAKELSEKEGIKFDEAYNRIMFKELDSNNQ